MLIVPPKIEDRAGGKPNSNSNISTMPAVLIPSETISSSPLITKASVTSPVNSEVIANPAPSVVTAVPIITPSNQATLNLQHKTTGATIPKSNVNLAPNSAKPAISAGTIPQKPVTYTPSVPSNTPSTPSVLSTSTSVSVASSVPKAPPTSSVINSSVPKPVIPVGNTLVSSPVSKPSAQTSTVPTKTLLMTQNASTISPKLAPVTTPKPAVAPTLTKPVITPASPSVAVPKPSPSTLITSNSAPKSVPPSANSSSSVPSPKTISTPSTLQPSTSSTTTTTPTPIPTSTSTSSTPAPSSNTSPTLTALSSPQNLNKLQTSMPSQTSSNTPHSILPTTTTLALQAALQAIQPMHSGMNSVNSLQHSFIMQAAAAAGLKPILSAKSAEGLFFNAAAAAAAAAAHQHHPSLVSAAHKLAAAASVGDFSKTFAALEDKKRSSGNVVPASSLPSKSSKASSVELENLELPPGWRTKAVTRKNGRSAGRVDRYWYSPDGLKFRSILAVKRYLTENVIPGQNKPSSTTPIDEKNKSTLVATSKDPKTLSPRKTLSADSTKPPSVPSATTTPSLNVPSSVSSLQSSSILPPSASSSSAPTSSTGPKRKREDDSSGPKKKTSGSSGSSKKDDKGRSVPMTMDLGLPLYTLYEEKDAPELFVNAFTNMIADLLPSTDGFSFGLGQGSDVSMTTIVNTNFPYASSIANLNTNMEEDFFTRESFDTLIEAFYN